MNARFLDFYNQELRFIREMGVEFAKRYPKIADKLDLGNKKCADPYVERLLEGFAFLTARIQLKLEAEFPRFTQHLLEMVYPHYLAPTPAMTIVKFQPDLQGGVSEKGFLLPVNTELRSGLITKGRTHCEFRTAHEVELWPIKLSEASYVSTGKMEQYACSNMENVKAAMRFKLESVAGFNFQQIPLDKLTLFLQGSDSLPMQLYELLIGHGVGILLQEENSSRSWKKYLGKCQISAAGFEDHQALMPSIRQTFTGYRLLQEYFVLPQRFMFVEFTGLQQGLRQCSGSTLEIIVLLDSAQNELEDLISVDNFALFCTPAINLFPKRTDRIHLSHRSTEHQVLVDKTRTRDYEVHSVSQVTGYIGSNYEEQDFQPFYAMQEGTSEQRAYYTIRRQLTRESVSRQESHLTRKAPYIGHEVFISLVDANTAPFNCDLKQLGVEVFCTNRDLPQLMTAGQGRTDFTLEISAPVDAVRCVTEISDPQASHPEGDHSWRLISHLSLNYLSLLDKDQGQGAAALREMLMLYGDFADSSIRKQIDGLLSISSRPIMARIPIKGPMCFGRGVEISMTFDEKAFEGVGVFLLGGVLEQFLSKYVSVNSFTQTVVNTRERGEIMRWPARTGTRTLI